MLAVDSTSWLQNSSVVKPLSDRRIFCEEKQGNVVHVQYINANCNKYVRLGYCYQSKAKL